MDTNYLTEERPDQLVNLRTGKYCDCCLVIRDAKRPGIVPAEYRYLTQVGHDVPLCARCLASWQANAEEDPSLAAIRITKIDSQE